MLLNNLTGEKNGLAGSSGRSGGGFGGGGVPRLDLQNDN
jgi:hypothetical protein